MDAVMCLKNRGGTITGGSFLLGIFASSGSGAILGIEALDPLQEVAHFLTSRRIVGES